MALNKKHFWVCCRSDTIVGSFLAWIDPSSHGTDPRNSIDHKKYDDQHILR